MRRAALALLLLGRSAQAAPWTVTLEGGAEADSNVERVETGPGLDITPIAAGVARLGARLDHADKIFGGGYTLGASGLGRYVMGNDEASPENVFLVAADLRWLHAVGERPVHVGFAVTGADAIAITDSIGNRTFSNLGADALLAFRSGDDKKLTLAVGGRDFIYKPDREFDWTGPVANARLDLVLWQPEGQTKSFELAGTAAFEARTYNSNAFADSCAIGEAQEPICFAPTTIRRRDRVQRIGLELTWVGDFVAALGYQLTVVDSNSYGQSLIRHRATLSGTKELFWGIFGTAIATLQIDRYLNGLLVQSDFQHTEFTNLEDENRSSIQVRLARPVTSTISVEMRGAIWRGIGDSMSDAFSRELLYAGLIYTN
jgi:hypothetical protein